MKHPEIPLFLNSGELVGSRKILRQLYSASVTRRFCSSLDRSGLQACDVVQPLTSPTCLFRAERQLVLLVLHGFRSPSGKRSAAHPQTAAWKL